LVCPRDCLSHVACENALVLSQFGLREKEKETETETETEIAREGE